MPSPPSPEMQALHLAEEEAGGEEAEEEEQQSDYDDELEEAARKEKESVTKRSREKGSNYQNLIII